MHTKQAVHYQERRPYCLHGLRQDRGAGLLRPAHEAQRHIRQPRAPAGLGVRGTGTGGWVTLAVTKRSGLSSTGLGLVRRVWVFEGRKELEYHRVGAIVHGMDGWIRVQTKTKAKLGADTYIVLGLAPEKQNDSLRRAPSIEGFRKPRGASGERKYAT